MIRRPHWEVTRARCGLDARVTRRCRTLTEAQILFDELWLGSASYIIALYHVAADGTRTELKRWRQPACAVGSLKSRRNALSRGGPRV